jgi:tight adherence protein B
MAGQLALSTDEDLIAAAAVWETLPPAVQQRVTLQLARLLARLVEGERDERGLGLAHARDRRGPPPRLGDVLDRGLDDALALRAARRADRDLNAVVLGHLPGVDREPVAARRDDRGHTGALPRRRGECPAPPATKNMQSTAPLLAGLAGAMAVVGAWEALAAVEQATVARAASRLAAPLRAAARHGREPSVPERRRLALTGAATLLGAGWLLAGPVAGVAAAAAGPWLAGRLVAARRARWRSELGRGAPAAARAMADALAGGHAVHGALASASTGGGLSGAVGAELRDATRALDLGERTEVVLERLRRRAADPRWDTIVAAILLQREAGGDLALLLRTTATAQEEAARVEADARSLTAQARFTAWLVTLLPVGAAVLGELAQPGSLMSLAREPLTALLLALAVACQVLAGVMVRRIARLEQP